MGVVKTWNGIDRASLKTFGGNAMASVKTINGFDATTGGGFVPSDIAGLIVWCAADGNVYTTGTTQATDGQTVTTWVNDGSSSNDFVQNTSGNRPVFKTNIVNSRPVLRFTAATPNSMVLSSFTGVQPSTIFVVVNNANTTANHTLIDGTSQFVQLLYVNTSGNLIQYAGGAGASVAMSSATWHVVAGVFNGASSYISLDGTPTSTASPGAGNAGGLTIGTSGGGSFAADADIAEILYYDTQLSGTNVGLVESYLGTKYGITIS